MFLEYKKKLAEKKKIKANEHVSSRIEGQREQRERMKQTKLQFASSKAPSKLSVNEQKAVDQTLLNYFISKAVPLSHVDDPSFIALMNTMNPRANIMGCKKLRSLIKINSKLRLSFSRLKSWRQVLGRKHLLPR